MSKRIAIMQPYFFPYIGYFQLVKHVDKFVFYDDVNFIKQGWINRNKILINGQEAFITIPLSNASSFRLINEVEISIPLFNRMKKKFYKSLNQNYGNSPYFKDVNELIRGTMELDTNKISVLAQNSVVSISRYLDLKTEFMVSNNEFKNENLKGQVRVIDIVLREKANQYTNPIGGIKLYNEEDFMKKDIQLNFIKAKPIEYKQPFEDFAPNLSIIDVLMFNSKEEVKNILNQYIIV